MHIHISNILFYAACGTIAAALHATEAPITDVTVYPDRAVVKRTAVVPVAAGISEITLSNLTAQLLDESIQVAVRADGNLDILDVSVATRFGRSEEIARLQPLLDKQEQLQEELDKIGLELALLEQQKGFLGKIESTVTHPQPREADLPPVATWREMMGFLTDALGEILPRMQQANHTRRELQQELQDVEKEIAQNRGAGRREMKEVSVRVDSGEALEEVYVSLSYVVLNSGWSPVYNLRVDSTDQSVRLEYQASVRQRTGEDWERINLTLSTARPALGGTPPELHPWYVDVQPPLRPMAANKRMERDFVVMADEMVAAPAAFRDAEVETGLTAVNLRVPVETTIPSGTQAQRVGVSGTDLEGDFHYTIVPKLSPHAYLQSRVTYAGQAPLLPGRSTIFLDGNLVGHSQLPRVETGEEFDLSLGVDEAIRVERKLLRRFVEERGIISKSTRTRFEFQTVVTNNRATAANVEIFDNVPVAQQEKIDVELIELSGGVAVDDEPGLYQWDKTLAPGSSVEISLIFTVEHPRDMDISGL